MGADRGVALEDDRFKTDDELLLAEFVAAAIRKQPQPFDLILTGKTAIDADAGQLGPALAELLDLPHVGAVVELTASESQVKATRRVEGAVERFEGALPLLITCEKGLVEPRYPSLPNLMKAKKKPVDTLSAADLELPQLTPGSTVQRCAAPSASAGCQYIEGEPAEMARELVRLLREEAKII
jgi:electron transfer flavoprotein beta subunit